MKSIAIGNRLVGEGHPCFIIAEAGVNHNGDVELAKQLIDVAVEAGADAVKFQTFKAENVISSQAPKAPYQEVTTAEDESQLEMVKSLELPFDSFRELYEHCFERNILFLSTPFDYESADFLDSLGMAAFKVPSGEITNLPFLVHLAQKRKPMIISTGMSTLAEVRDALNAIGDKCDSDLILLHCVSNYPAELTDVNLLAMNTMSEEFEVPVGWSDHTEGNLSSIAAVVLGASVIEKHFTLDKDLPGPDHRASIEPTELVNLISEIRKIPVLLGTGEKIPSSDELNMALLVRKSLHLKTDLSKGHILSADDLIALRPGNGIPPSRISVVCGRKLKLDLTARTQLLGEHIE